MKPYRDKKYLSNQRGQSLLEVIIAIGIIVTGLFSVWSLFLSNYTSEQELRQKALAYNLAREGVEAVKNIRDSNWLRMGYNDTTCGLNNNETCTWDNGLDNGIGQNTAVIDNLFSNSYVALDFNAASSLDDDGAVIHINSDGFYDSSGSTATPYHRLIFIRNICCQNDSGDCTDAASLETKADGQICSVDQIKVGIDVQSKVRWPFKGQTKNVIVQDQFFNWR